MDQDSLSLRYDMNTLCYRRNSRRTTICWALNQTPYEKGSGSRRGQGAASPRSRIERVRSPSNGTVLYQPIGRVGSYLAVAIVRWPCSTKVWIAGRSHPAGAWDILQHPRELTSRSCSGCEYGSMEKASLWSSDKSSKLCYDLILNRVADRAFTLH